MLLKRASGKEVVIFHLSARDEITIAAGAKQFTLRLKSPMMNDGGGAGSGQIKAPMHGNILEIDVAVGDDVKNGQRLAIMDAMKMQHEILADVSGEIIGVLVAAGDQVATDDIIVQIKAEEEDSEQ